MSPGLLITLMNCRRRRRCCYCCPHKNRTNTHTLTHKRTHTHIGRQRDMDTHNSCQKVKIVEQRMQQDQQQRQQREEDIERQQKESMRGARAPPLSLSLCFSLVAFPPAKIVITFCLTEALLWEGDTCKADYWLKGSMGNEVNK